MGVLTFYTFLFQFLAGIALFLCNCVSPEFKRKTIVFHRFIGFISILLIVAAALTGLQEKLLHDESCDAIVPKGAHDDDEDDDDDHQEEDESQRRLHEGHQPGGMALSCYLGNYLGVLIALSAIMTIWVLIGTDVGTERKQFKRLKKEHEFEELNDAVDEFEIGEDSDDDEVEVY
eukprot:augustus_masked-scaffold_14-processed-gene-7.1-mRNA-1 protein AED:0.85 eAED:1.00 QI:0/-1/0/1/-1/1/1/0/174